MESPGREKGGREGRSGAACLCFSLRENVFLLFSTSTSTKKEMQPSFSVSSTLFYILSFLETYCVQKSKEPERNTTLVWSSQPRSFSKKKRQYLILSLLHTLSLFSTSNAQRKKHA